MNNWLETTRKITLPHGEISYIESAGTKNPTVFIHSNSSGLWSFSEQFNSPLASENKFFAIELPGHGITPIAESYSLELFKNCLIEFVEKFSLQKAYFVGHSLGGHILLQSLNNLKEIKGLMIFGTPPIGKPPLFEKAFLSHEFGHCFMQENLNEREYEGWARSCFHNSSSADAMKYLIMADPKVRSGIAASIMSMQYEDELETIKNLHCPLTIVHGEHDKFVNLDYIQEYVMSLNNNVELHVINNSGHYPHWERSEQFNKILKLKNN